MLLNVKSVYDNNPAFATARPAFGSVMSDLTTILGEIISLQTSQSTVSTGDTVDKENKHYDLSKKLFKIAAATSAYASKPVVNDPVLKAKVNFTLDQISSVPYNKTEAFANNILDAITTGIIANLGDYGVVTADKTAATNALTAYLLIQNAPQAIITERKVDTADIHPKVKEGKDLLTLQGDGIANTLFDDNHTLYELWYAARKIIHFPHGTTLAEGFVYKPDGRTGIYNADVRIGDITVKTMLDGSYHTRVPHGVVTPTASAVGYTSQTANPYEIKQGHTGRHDFIMQL